MLINFWIFLLLPCSLVWWCFIRQVNSLAEECLSTSVIHCRIFVYSWRIISFYFLYFYSLYIHYSSYVFIICLFNNVFVFFIEQYSLCIKYFLRKIILLNDFIFTFSLIIHTIMFGCSRFIRYIDHVFQIVIVILYQYFSKHIILFALFVFC